MANNDMMESLMNLLSQEGAKEKVTDMLSGILGNGGTPSGSTGQEPQREQQENSGRQNFLTPENMEMLMKAKSMMDQFNDISDERITLLHAIKPFMAGRRSSGIDMMVKLIQVMKFSSGLQNQKGEKG